MSAPQRPGLVVLVLLLSHTGAGPVHGQTVRADTEAIRYSFDDPLGVGLESLDLSTVSFGVAHPVTPSIDVGLSARWASGSMAGQDGSSVQLTGFTDTELFGELRRGALSFRLTAVLPTGRTGLDDEAVALAALTSYEFLTFPRLLWGSGGSTSAEAAIGSEWRSAWLRASAGLTAHRAFDLSADAPRAFRPGMDRFLAVAIDGPRRALNRGSIAFALRSFAPDRIGANDVFEPGLRIEATGWYTFSVAGTIALVGVRARRRLEGDALRVGGAGPLGFSEGFDSPARSLLDLRIEASTPLRWFDLTGSARARGLRDAGIAGTSALFSGAVGVRSHTTADGRLSVHTTVRLTWGRAVVAREYTSPIRGLGLDLTIRWRGR